MKKISCLMLIIICMVCLCGCTKTCTACNVEIEKDKEVQIENASYCENCIEYCNNCTVPCVNEKGKVFKYNYTSYCKECFEKKAFPIVLEDNENVTVAITGYDDNEGLFAVTVNNKTDYNISIFERNDSVLLDGNSMCIGETGGTHSFAYMDVPAKQQITVFSSFRQSPEEWDTILKISENHTFELVLTAWIDDDDFDGFWDKDFKVTLIPEMFGYYE